MHQSDMFGTPLGTPLETQHIHPPEKAAPVSAFGGTSQNVNDLTDKSVPGQRRGGVGRLNALPRCSPSALRSESGEAGSPATIMACVGYPHACEMLDAEWIPPRRLARPDHFLRRKHTATCGATETLSGNWIQAARASHTLTGAASIPKLSQVGCDTYM